MQTHLMLDITLFNGFIAQQEDGVMAQLFSDPRTGEIIKGHVSLGSLRFDRTS